MKGKREEGKRREGARERRGKGRGNKEEEGGKESACVYYKDCDCSLCCSQDVGEGRYECVRVPTLPETPAVISISPGFR